MANVLTPARDTQDLLRLADEVKALRHKLWMIACHATGGGIPEIEGIDRSVNDICVQISASRNVVYQAGKEQGAKEAFGPDVIKHSTSISLEDAMQVIRSGDMHRWSGAIYDHLRNYAAARAHSTKDSSNVG